MDFLFDIGKVLLDFEFERSLARLLPAHVNDHASRLTRLLDRKDEFESGRIATDDFTTWALDVLESPADAEQFTHAWRDIFTVNRPMVECATALAAEGHRLILFSNTNDLHTPWIFEAYPDVFAPFHDAVLSQRVGSMKPHASIYHHATERFGLIPSETLYIDDLPANITTGKELGFRSWQYDITRHDEFEAWLASELSRVKSGV